MFVIFVQSFNDGWFFFFFKEKNGLKIFKGLQMPNIKNVNTFKKINSISSVKRTPHDHNYFIALTGVSSIWEANLKKQDSKNT